MVDTRRVPWIARLAGGSAAVALTFVATAQGQGPPLVPDSFDLIEPAAKAIDAAWLTVDERSNLRVFHGAWTEADLDTPARRAMAALSDWRLDDASLGDGRVPVELRAEGLLRQGELQGAIDLLDGAESLHAARVIAEALEQLGLFDRADAAVDVPVSLLTNRKLDDAGSLTEGVRSLIVRSRLRGQPARDYQTTMNLLSRARTELDRLYWPAVLTEAGLLLDKDNHHEAIGALHQVLGLNPRCSEAWYQLGQIALGRFDFDSAGRAVSVLRGFNAAHPLADLLEARISIVQDEPSLALEVLDGTIGRWPGLRRAHALRCAAIALQYDEAALQTALDGFDELSPGSADAYYLAGQAMSFDRQYGQAADLLNEAIRRQPKWPRPRIELGLLELQAGRDALALAALREVRELDRFNTRVANSLHLLEQLAEYKQIETEHFIIRYSHETDDQVLVDMMPDTLEQIHSLVSGRFEHEPDQKTIIELLPNHPQFAVRISGMPHIHTIAACTGPVIAMEVPREGRKQLHFGVYDWPRVLQHEYTHTITLSQTRNRIPHWLTEAAAVSMELKPRGYDTIQQLVNAFQHDDLFDLDEINWAFIRPKRPGDRGLAYAQGHWMVEFMNERFGSSALIRLTQRYFDGEREAEAIPSALGVSREEFFDAFLLWADGQVRSWGFAAEPRMESLLDELREKDPDTFAQAEQNRRILLDAMVREMTRRVGKPAPDGSEPLTTRDWPTPPKPEIDISHEQLAQWLDEYPDHPDLVKLAMDRAIAMAEKPGLDLVPLLMKYAELRPVDPAPHRTLALIWQGSGDHDRAIEHLEFLDIRAQYTNVFAVALARIYRDRKQYETALTKITRAININPYHAPNRELAAAISVQAGKLDLARQHIVALTLLEPDRPQHQRRLDAIDRMLAGQSGG